MVKQYSQLYLDARNALLEKEDPQMATMMARSILCHATGKTRESILLDKDATATEEECRSVNACPLHL